MQPRLVAPDLAYHLRISLGIQWPAHVAHLPQPLKVGAQTKISRISKMDWSCVIPIRMCCMISTVCRYWCLPSSLWLQTIALVEIHLRCLWWSNICNLLLCRNFLCCYVSSVIAFPLVQKSYDYCSSFVVNSKNYVSFQNYHMSFCVLYSPVCQYSVNIQYSSDVQYLIKFKVTK